MAVAAGRYPTGSEARQAVLCSAANRGWTLADVTTRIDDGRWAGLRQLYTRYRTGRQRALARDWNKALSRAVRKSAGPVSTSDTSPNTHRGTRGTTERDQISKEWISVFLDAATNASPRWGRNAGRNRGAAAKPRLRRPRTLAAGSSTGACAATASVPGWAAAPPPTSCARSPAKTTRS